jgi:hypothetical protein
MSIHNHDSSGAIDVFADAPRFKAVAVAAVRAARCRPICALRKSVSD